MKNFHHAVIAPAFLILSSLDGHAIPFNDSFASAADLGSEARLHRYSDPRVATLEDFEFGLGVSDDSTPFFERTGSLWFTWTAPSAGTYHVSGYDSGDLVDVYRNDGGSPGSVIKVDNQSFQVPIAAASGEIFFIRHTGRLTNPFDSGDDSPPVGILMRKEATGVVTDFGTRDGLAGYLTSFGATNSERYRWTAGKTGRLTVRVERFSSEGVVSLRVNGTSVPGFQFDTEETVEASAGDLFELELSGNLGFAQINVTPEDPGSTDIGANANVILPSRPESGGVWEWMAPANGILRLELNSSIGFFNGFSLNDLTTFDGIDIGLGLRDADCVTLGYKSAIVRTVEAGEALAFNESGFDPGYSSGFFSLKFFSQPVTINERIDAASANLDLSTAAGLDEADAQLAAALAMDPTHPAANALRAVTRLLLLEREPAYEVFLQSIGVAADSDGTGIFDAEYELTEDVNGDLVFPANSGATDRISALKTLISPRLAEIRGYLDAAVPAGERRTYLAATGAFVLDEADILAIKATTNIIQALLDLLSVYDLGGSLNAFVSLERDGELDLETALAEFPALLNVADSGAIAGFKTRITDANTQLCAALVMASGNRTICGKHPFPPVGSVTDGEDLIGLVENIDEITKAFSGPVEIGGETIDLSKFNVTSAGLRSFLPAIRENKALGFTGSDPTLGGIFPNATALESPLQSTLGLADPAGFSMYIRNLVGEGMPSFLYDFEGDNDSDGETNGREYFFGSDPTDPSVKAQSPVAKLEMTPGGRKFRVSFVRRLNTTDSRYVAAVSEDLKTWDYSETKVALVGSAVPVGDGRGEIATVEIDSDLSGSMFVRIHAVAK